MTGWTLFAFATAFVLLSAPVGAAGAAGAANTAVRAPVTGTSVSDTSEVAANTASPASIMVTVRTSPLAQPIAYLDAGPLSGQVTHLMVYFAPGDIHPGEEARLALAALADEAAVNAAALLTVTATDVAGGSSETQDARAAGVFNMLIALGVPSRAVALDLLGEEDASDHADVVANAI